MKRYSHQQIEDLLDKFMNGQTTLEEEAALSNYFRTHDVPQEWEDYRVMFGYFDRGMEGELVTPREPSQSLARLMGRRWWGIASAAAIAAVIVGSTMFYHPSTTNQPVVAKDTQEETQDAASQQTTEQSLEAPTAPPVETQNLASRPAVPKTGNERANSTRRLQAQNAKLARENERLQRELEDLRRRAFIIDLEANGYRAIQNEDGNIVLIDLEQEIEKELNNQPTNNLPEI